MFAPVQMAFSTNIPILVGAVKRDLLNVAGKAVLDPLIERIKRNPVILKVEYVVCGCGLPQPFHRSRETRGFGRVDDGGVKVGLQKRKTLRLIFRVAKNGVDVGIDVDDIMKAKSILRKALQCSFQEVGASACYDCNVDIHMLSFQRQSKTNTLNDFASHPNQANALDLAYGQHGAHGIHMLVCRQHFDHEVLEACEVFGDAVEEEVAFA